MRLCYGRFVHYRNHDNTAWWPWFVVEEQEPLKAGDVVKIELGCHVDYYSSVAAHTVKVRTGLYAPPIYFRNRFLGTRDY